MQDFTILKFFYISNFRCQNVNRNVHIEYVAKTIVKYVLIKF